MPPLPWYEVHPAAPPYSDSQADEAFWHRPLEVSFLRRSELRLNQMTRPIYSRSVTMNVYGSTSMEVKREAHSKVVQIVLPRANEKAATGVAAF